MRARGSKMGVPVRAAAWLCVVMALAGGCGSSPRASPAPRTAETTGGTEGTQEPEAPEAPPPLVLVRPPPGARERIDRWTFAELIPLQRWAAVPGRVIGLLYAAGEQPWGTTYHHAGVAPTIPGRTEYRFVTGTSSPWALYFVSDGRGENFMQMPGAERTYDVAMFRPDTPNGWGLERPAHLVELEVDGGRGGIADYVHFIATDARVLDGTEGYPRDVTTTLVALRDLLDARLAEDGFEADVSEAGGGEIGAVFRADVAALEARTADGTDAGTHTTIASHPTWDPDTHRLVVLFFTTRFVARVVVREEPFRCAPRAPCAAPRPPEPETHRGGVQLAIRYEVDATDTVVREITYAARPLSDAPPIGY